MRYTIRHGQIDCRVILSRPLLREKWGFFYYPPLAQTGFIRRTEAILP